VSVFGNAELSIEGCMLLDSSATIGGCLDAFGNSRTRIISSTFTRCAATKTGGAVSVSGHAELFVEGCMCLDSNATTGGCLDACDNSRTRTISSTFTRCAATALAGAVSVFHDAEMSIEGCLFLDGKAAASGVCVCVFATGRSSVSITRSNFTRCAVVGRLAEDRTGVQVLGIEG
jgi:hypothetical protein